MPIRIHRLLRFLFGFQKCRLLALVMTTEVRPELTQVRSADVGADVAEPVAPMLDDDGEIAILIAVGLRLVELSR